MAAHKKDVIAADQAALKAFGGITAAEALKELPLGFASCSRYVRLRSSRLMRWRSSRYVRLRSSRQVRWSSSRYVRLRSSRCRRCRISR
jgi:Arc/MetJ family transcription regulator